ncbi:MAG: SDR family NAD(P)-dependent oxidoreductase [Burkholderiaceae bacterium]
MELGLQKRVALVTGAGNGIGRACALGLAREGCLVALADIDVDAARATEALISSERGTASAFGMDVQDAASVKSVVSSVFGLWGRLDILVNNAGFSRDSQVDSMNDAQWADVIGVNLTGQFHCIREVVPHMKASGFGRIVNMASRAHYGDINKSNYSASKAGVIGLTKALALELGPSGITVNAVAPGIISTDRLEHLPQFEQIRARAIASMPIKRIGRTEEVADAVTFLSSINASFITGEVLHVSGGRYG